MQLKVGSLAFGGPLAAIAMMKKYWVEDLRFVDNKKFLDSLAFVKLLPGPAASMLALFLGLELAGFWGGFLAGLCFILPSFILLLTISNFEHFIEASNIQNLGLSFAPLLSCILGLIAYTCYKLFRDCLDLSKQGGSRSVSFCWGIFMLAAFLAWTGISEFIILLFCGVLGLLWNKWGARGLVLKVALLPIFLVFFTAAFSVFGTGYMVLPALQKTLVFGHQWLNADEFLRAVTYGNLTPGPIVIASTYMGFKMAGNLGALVATVGIFAPAFILVLFFSRPLKKVLLSPKMSGFSEGVLPAVSSTIFLSLWPLAQGMNWNLLMGVAFALGFVLSFRKVAAFKILFVGMLLIFLEASLKT